MRGSTRLSQNLFSFPTKKLFCLLKAKSLWPSLSLHPATFTFCRTSFRENPGTRQIILKEVPNLKESCLFGHYSNLLPFSFSSSFSWAKNAVIFLHKNETSRPMKLIKMDDLTKLMTLRAKEQLTFQMSTSVNFINTTKANSDLSSR